jgi:hypothetical protein
MKLNSLALLLSGLILAACAGEKNEVQADGTVLAVRTMETGEVTEVALLEGDFATPEQAQIAAESANWIPMSQFSRDQELDFVDTNAEEMTDFVEFANQFSRDDRRRVTPRDDRRSDSRRDRGPDRRNNDRRFTSRHNDGRGNWRPHRLPNDHWRRGYSRWQAPQRPVWNYRRCSYRYIWYGNRCLLPITRRHNVIWLPQYGYIYRPRVPHRHYGQVSWKVSIYFPGR